jgi:thiol-disulfide isomerase/thioredoxin
MKKYLIGLLVSIFLFIPSVSAVELPEKTDHEKVKVNLFWASWCSNCHNLINYFKDNWVDYQDYFEFVTYRLDINGKSTTNTANSTIMKAVAKEFGIDDDDLGIPFIVIGDEFYTNGFSANTGQKIIEAALEEYQNEDYTDLVSELISKKSLESDEKTFSDACKAASIDCVNENGEKGVSDGLIIAIIFGVVVVGFAGLIVFSRKD